jgi:GT2 family glycosyltransferase
MSDKIPKIAVVLVNYNTTNDTIECIQSIYKSNFTNYCVIVIDNASEVNPEKLIKKDFPDIIYFANNENIGFSRACNKGIDIAFSMSIDYVLLLNNDTVINENTLFNLLETFDYDNNTGIVSGIIYYYSNPEKIWYAGGKYSWLNIGMKHITKLKSNSKKVFETDIISGCCMLIKKDVIDKIGKLNEAYFYGVEDMEYCFIAKKNGIKLAVNVNANIYHKIGASNNGHSERSVWYTACSIYSRVVFMKLFIKDITLYTMFIIFFLFVYNIYLKLLKFTERDIVIFFVKQSIAQGHFINPHIIKSFMVNKELNKF